MEGDLAWRGLWHPKPRSAGGVGDWLVRALVFFATPLALALLNGFDSLERFGRAYLAAFLIGASIAGPFELLYLLAWPALVRRRHSLPARLAGHAATLVVAVGIGGVLGDALGHAVLDWNRSTVARIWIQGAVIASVVLTLLITIDELGARARELERREARQRSAALRAELAALQARTDPHFLFNSLNTVAALIPDDPALAEASLVRLSAVFRYALEAGRRGAVALSEELAAVTAYLEVEALRLGPRLAWRLEQDPALADARVPPLVLQPLVENAILHGAGRRRGATQLAISAHRREGELVLSVEDQGAAGEAARPAAPGATAGAGTALAELRARLALAYAGRARLDAGAAPPAGWRAEVRLPLAPLAAPPAPEPAP